MRRTPAEAAGMRAHGDDVYCRHGPEQVSRYQTHPPTSLELIETIDVGGGASPLAATLTGHGFADLTVLDLSTSSSPAHTSSPQPVLSQSSASPQPVLSQSSASPQPVLSQSSGGRVTTRTDDD